MLIAVCCVLQVSFLLLLHPVVLLCAASSSMSLLPMCFLSEIADGYPRETFLFYLILLKGKGRSLGR